MSEAHDPFCGRSRGLTYQFTPCQCDLIARVRADERKQARLYGRGYIDGLIEARRAVLRVPDIGHEDGHPSPIEGPVVKAQILMSVDYLLGSDSVSDMP